MRPCRVISKATTDYLNNLNNLNKYDNSYLDSFEGRKAIYGHLQLKDEDFLTSHSRKHVVEIELFNYAIIDMLCCLVISCRVLLNALFLCSVSVSGDSLKKVLDSGVREKMDKAMMFLVQKAAAGAIDGQRDTLSKARHSVSLELLDENGVVVPDETGVVSGKVVSRDPGGKDGQLVARRKRGREEDVSLKPVPEGIESVGDGGVNKMITITGGNRIIMTSTTDPRSSKEAFGVSIASHERWAGGSSVPLRDFQMFNLSQDACAYVGRSRVDLVDRCLGRAGRVIPLFFQVFFFRCL